MEALGLAVPERNSVSLSERTAARKRAQNRTAQTARKIRLALDEVRRKYRYRRLPPDHTRLLVIHPPRNGPDELYVELTEVPLRDLGTKVNYEALSYHWGGGSDLKPIYVRAQAEVNSEIHGDWEDSLAAAKHRSLQMIAKDVLLRKLHIKTNLYSALRHLRLNTRPVTLWVDALCIDQSDSLELGQQVAKMVDIYSRASQVVVWLGDEEPQSRRAIEFIQDITDAEDIDSILSDHSKVESWGDLIYLMQNPWFSRRLVIQEMVHARRAIIQLSELSISWNRFRDAAGLLALNAPKVRALLRPALRLSTGLGEARLFPVDLESLDFFLQNKLNGLPAKVFIDVLDYMFWPSRSSGIDYHPTPIHGLEYLVSSLYIYDNSDPRDTIFALRNLAEETSKLATLGPDSSALPLRPEYTKTVVEVYCEFVEWAVRTSFTLDILCRPWASNEHIQLGARPRAFTKFPSWIRTATEKDKSRRGSESLTFVGLPGEQIYNACYGTVERAKFNETVSDFWTAVAAHSQSLVGQSSSSHTSPSELPGISGLLSLAQPSKKRERENDSSNADLLSPEQPGAKRTRGHEKSFSTPKPSDVQPGQHYQKAYELTVEGLRVGSISWNTGPIEDGVVPQQAIERLRGPKVGHAPKQLWRTLIAERGPDGNNPPHWYERAARNIMATMTPNGHLNVERLLSQPQPAIVRSYLERAQAVTCGRCIIEVTDEHTQQQLFGLGPANTRRDDILCVLFGCSVPCVLRPIVSSREGDHFKFIGEAYIYGLMDAEAISSLSAEELKTRTTTFRLL